MAITDYATAREAVQRGVTRSRSPPTSSRAMTPYERLWCLDGDAPTWAGLTYLTGDDGYHRLPFTAARNDRLGIPGIAFADGPARRGDRQRHRLPGDDGARRHVGPRPGGEGRTGDRGRVARVSARR